MATGEVTKTTYIVAMRDKNVPDFLVFINQKDLPPDPSVMFNTCDDREDAMEYTRDDANAWVDYITNHRDSKYRIAKKIKVQYVKYDEIKGDLK